MLNGEYVRDLKWLVRLFDTQQQLDDELERGSVIEPFGGVSIRRSFELFDEHGIGIPSLWSQYVYEPGNIITTYTGRAVDKNSVLATQSDHVITYYGHPNLVLVGLTSHSRKLQGRGLASLVNDNTIDVLASEKATRAAGKPLIVRTPGAKSNAALAAFVLRDEYERMRRGENESMPSARVVLVALERLSEGDEIFAGYGDTYWVQYLQSLLDNSPRWRSAPPLTPGGVGAEPPADPPAPPLGAPLSAPQTVRRGAGGAEPPDSRRVRVQRIDALMQRLTMK